MIKKQNENIIGILLGISLFLHLVGYFFWPLVKWVNIYYVSIYFLMLNVGLALMMVAVGKVMKYVSMGMFTFGGQFLFMEFAGDPQDWTNVDLLTLLFICANSLLVSFLIDKYKKQKQ